MPAFAAALGQLGDRPVRLAAQRVGQGALAHARLPGQQRASAAQALDQAVEPGAVLCGNLDHGHADPSVRVDEVEVGRGMTHAIDQVLLVQDQEGRDPGIARPRKVPVDDERIAARPGGDHDAQLVEVGRDGLVEPATVGAHQHVAAWKALVDDPRGALVAGFRGDRNAIPGHHFELAAPDLAAQPLIDIVGHHDHPAPV